MRWFDAWSVTFGDALVGPLAVAGNAQAMLLRGCRKSAGEGKLSRQTFNLFCESGRDTDLRYYSVRSPLIYYGYEYYLDIINLQSNGNKPNS